MAEDIILNVSIEELLPLDAGQKLRQIADTMEAIQQRLYVAATSEDDKQQNLLKIGTVFQIFFIEALASGKSPRDLTREDWEGIAKKVDQYAVMGDDRQYSEFVFTQYADYIDVSAEILQAWESENTIATIKDLAATIRANTERLHAEEISESLYIEACLWLSLEAMMKLLCSFLTKKLAREYAELFQSVSQLAFEYGRLVLYETEQAILEEYIRNQHVLDEQLQEKYERYLAEVRIQSEAFRELVENAFSSDIRDALKSSAALAKAAGVSEDEVLTSIEDVDAFFAE